MVAPLAWLAYKYLAQQGTRGADRERVSERQTEGKTQSVRGTVELSSTSFLACCTRAACERSTDIGQTGLWASKPHIRTADSGRAITAQCKLLVASCALQHERQRASLHIAAPMRRVVRKQRGEALQRRGKAHRFRRRAQRKRFFSGMAASISWPVCTLPEWLDAAHAQRYQVAAYTDTALQLTTAQQRI